MHFCLTMLALLCLHQVHWTVQQSNNTRLIYSVYGQTKTGIFLSNKGLHCVPHTLQDCNYTNTLIHLSLLIVLVLSLV